MVSLRCAFSVLSLGSPKLQPRTAIESAQNDQATMVQTMLDSKEAILDKLKALFYEIDVEEDAGKKHAGSLTVTMFEEKMRNPDVHNFFESLGLDVWDACPHCIINVWAWFQRPQLTGLSNVLPFRQSRVSP